MTFIAPNSYYDLGPVSDESQIQDYIDSTYGGDINAVIDAFNDGTLSDGVDLIDLFTYFAKYGYMGKVDEASPYFIDLIEDPEFVDTFQEIYDANYALSEQELLAQDLKEMADYFEANFGIDLGLDPLNVANRIVNQWEAENGALTTEASSGGSSSFDADDLAGALAAIGKVAPWIWLLLHAKYVTIPLAQEVNESFASDVQDISDQMTNIQEDIMSLDATDGEDQGQLQALQMEYETLKTSRQLVLDIAKAFNEAPLDELELSSDVYSTYQNALQRILSNY